LCQKCHKKATEKLICHKF